MRKMINQNGILHKRVFYTGTIYDEKEIKAVVESLKNNWLANGPLVAEFESKISSLFGKKYGIAVNSGSSANLLAIASLNLPRNGIVITPSLTFSTTVSAIVINNLIPKFVDCVIGRYTINEDLIEKAIDKDTVAIMIPQLIGGVCDMIKIRQIANKFNLKVIDDSCDTLAPMIGGKTVASYADITTASFYGSHIITAMGIGGMIITDDPEVRNNSIAFRDWGRTGSDHEDFDKRFNFQIDNIPYDGKFLYSHLGFNLKLNEASAAFALEQLKKLPDFLGKRRNNWNMLYSKFKKFENYFYLPELMKGASTHWLAFPLTIKQESPFTRFDLLKHFESDGIQTRVLFSGNITRHPAIKNIEHKIYGTLINSDIIMQNGFLLGAHHAMGVKEINVIEKSFDDFMRNRIFKKSNTLK